MDYYPQMYRMLFNKITDVISELQAIQQEAEELFIMSAPEQKFPQPQSGKNPVPVDHISG